MNWCGATVYTIQASQDCLVTKSFFPQGMICNWELGLLGTHFEKCRSRPQTLLADGERGLTTAQTLLLRSDRENRGAASGVHMGTEEGLRFTKG